MKVQKSSYRFALLLMIFAFLQTSVSAKDQWIRVSSKNFNLIGNADEKSIRDVAVRLEQFRQALSQILNQLNFDSPIPTTVIVFKSSDDYKPFKPVKSNGETENIVLGYFLPGHDVNYITLSAEGESVSNYSVIFHEYTHFLVRNNLGESVIPPWYNEGIAKYYETFAVEDDQKVTLGDVPSKIPTLLAQNKLIPFDTFFDMDNYTLHEQGSDGIGLFYAQAWALMHYLIHGNGGARKTQLDKFLKLVTTGASAKKAFAEAFDTDYATMETELKKYIAQNAYPFTTVLLKNKLSFDAEEMKSAPLTDAEAEAYLGDLLYHSNRLTEAEVHLRNSLKLNSNLGLAQTSLGLVKLKQGNFTEAENYLEKAVESDSENYLAHYNYAYVLSRQGMTEFGFVSEYNIELADKMRKALKKAIALNPDFAESYNLYAFVNVVRNEAIDEAIAYLNKALKIAPGNQWYLIRLAELYMRKEDFGNARNIAAKVAQTAADRELKVYSENTLKLIISTEAAYWDIKNYNKRKGIKDYLDRILTNEEFARLRDQRILESINEAVNKPKTGEKRILGYLTRIDCEPEEMIYSVKVEDKIIKLRSPSFYTVRLTAYTSDMAAWQIACGQMKKDSFAVINYRPAENPKVKTSGEIVSIEFVPENFKFLN